MAGDERVRVFGEDVADAREALLAERRRQGRRLRDHPRPPARVRTRPLLQLAARGVEHHRPCDRAGDPRAAARARDPVLRLHLARDATAQERGGDDPLALQRRVHRADGRARPDRRLPAGRCDLALAVGRVDLRPRPRVCSSRSRRAPRDAVGLLRTAFRCEDPVLFLEHKHLLRQPYARDPFPPDDYVVPFGRGAIRRPGTDLTIVTWGATVQKSLEAAARLHDELDREVEVDRPALARPVGPRPRRGVGAAHRPAARRARGRRCTCGFGAEVAAWAADELFTDLRAPIRRVAALDTHVGVRADARSRDPPAGRRHRGRRGRPVGVRLTRVGEELTHTRSVASGWSR